MTTAALTTTKRGAGMADPDRVLDALEKLRESQESNLEATKDLLQELRAKHADAMHRISTHDILLRGDGQAVPGILPRVSQLETDRKSHGERLDKIDGDRDRFIWAGLAGMGAVVLALATALGAMAMQFFGGNGGNGK